MTEKGTFVIDFRSVERKTMMTITLAIAILLFPAPSSAKDLTSLVGLARVIDGDTVEIAGERVHLQGVDTPEPDQECRNARNVAYPCGQDATNALRARIGDDSIRCEIEPKRDSYGRAIGVCFALDGTDLNGWLVRYGYGLAYRQYSKRYADVEEAARADELGLHQGTHTPPWLYRQGNRLR